MPAGGATIPAGASNNQARAYEQAFGSSVEREQRGYPSAQGTRGAVLPSRYLVRTEFDHNGHTVVVSKDTAGWHVQSGNDAPVVGRFLDQALTDALPGTGKREIDRILLRLLEWSADADRGEETAAVG